MGVLSLIFAYLAGVLTVFIWAFVKGVAVMEQREREKEEAEENKKNTCD